MTKMNSKKKKCKTEWTLGIYQTMYQRIINTWLVDFKIGYIARGVYDKKTVEEH